MEASFRLFSVLQATYCTTLAMAGLNFRVEKALKKIFGSGVGPDIQLYNLVQQLQPEQK